MVDFVEAIDKGLKLAKEAEESLSEIELVLRELSDQVETRTSGKVFVFRKAHPLRDGFTHVLRAGPLSDDDDEGLETIAKLKCSDGGYPITVAFGGREYVCEDKEGFVSALSEMLVHPTNARIIYKLYTRPSASAPGDATPVC